MYLMRDALISGLKNIIKPLVPEPLKERLRGVETRLRSTESVFTEIYEKKKWGDRDSKDLYSGPGSRGAPAEKYVETITKFISENKIASVVDLGCGDFIIGKSIAEATGHYTGVDVVKMVVDHHIANFGSDKIHFKHLDIVKDE